MIIEKNNNDIPDYLDEKFFTNAMINRLNSNDFSIKSLNFSMGSSGGENYLSYIYRAEVVYTHEGSAPKRLSFIVKSVPLDGVREVFAEMKIFIKEKEMYVNIIPQIEDCLDGANLAPRCYHFVKQPTATIVFEDMTVLGYGLADRIKGMDEDHCRILLAKLAQYHAGSMILIEKDPSLRELDLFKDGIFSEWSFSKEMMRDSVDGNFSRLIKHVSSWPGYEKIVSKLQKLHGKEFCDRIIDAIRMCDDDIVAICHGDMWVNNFLFKYENNNKVPTDVALIDFQGSKIGSIGLDINYFLVSSLEMEIFINKRDELIENSYYPTFKATLEKSHIKIPSLQDVRNEIRKKAYYGFMSAILVLPTIGMSKEDSADSSIEKFVDEEAGDKLKDTACSTGRFLETMKYLLKEYDEIGLLD